MKKLLLGIATFVTMAVLCIVSAGAETYGDLNYYVLDDGTVAIDGSKSGVTTINIPSKINGRTVTRIEEGAFYLEAHITSVTIPDTVTSIGYGAFWNCSALTSITIPDSVITIDGNAFSNCGSLKSVTIGKNVKTIGTGAFEFCANLASITIPDSVTRICDSAFWMCEKLTHVTLGNGLISIEEAAFSQCPSLTSINIPKSVTSIGDHGIGYCYDYDLRKYYKSEKLVISCYKGTAGEQYVLNEGFNYKLITAPSAVKGLKIGGRASNALRLNWTKNTSADGYIIEQYKGGKWVRVARIAGNSTTTYRVTGLKASTQYKFRMKAYKIDGTSALYSSYTSTLAAYTNPSAVSNLKITGKAGTALRLGWSKNTSADGYIVEMYSGGKWVRVARIAGNATVTYRKAGLKKGTTYKFRVRTYNIVGKTALYGAYVNVSGTTNK